MSALDQLETLLTSDKDWARRRAETAKAVYEQYQQGNLSDSEYQELLEDLVRTDQLNSEADDAELRANLVSTVNVLSKLA